MQIFPSFSNFSSVSPYIILSTLFSNTSSLMSIRVLYLFHLPSTLKTEAIRLFYVTAFIEGFFIFLSLDFFLLSPCTTAQWLAYRSLRNPDLEDHSRCLHRRENLKNLRPSDLYFFFRATDNVLHPYRRTFKTVRAD
jgi:hypothetical protein